jgi:DNA polymerase-3 subunit delta'
MKSEVYCWIFLRKSKIAGSGVFLQTQHRNEQEKVRMQDFDQIVGQGSVIQHLQNAIRLGKVSHAYIFEGEEGSGKKLLAGVFAKTLQCEEGKSMSCNHCRSCMQADTGNQPDIIRVTHEKASIGVDDIRLQVNGDIQIKPYHSPYKIYIIDSAEKMTEQAQNALLKTLEEPPEYAVILLLTDNKNKLLPTILSRSVQLQLRPVDKQDIKQFLMEKHQVPDYLAEVSADFSSGNVGKALKYASSEEFEQMKGEVLDLLKNIGMMEQSELISKSKKIASHRESIMDYIDLMLLWYRDVLMLKATGKPDLLLYRERYPQIREQAVVMSYEGIERCIKAIEQVKLQQKANVNSEAALELMLLTIKENWNG